ncbi:hypothetical protein D3C78_487230 [compost metagenome]
MSLAQLLGLLGQVAWVAEVRRQVAQVAGEGHAGGDGGGVVCRTLHFGQAGLVGQQGDLFQRAWLGFLALETVEHVFAIKQGFGQQAVFAVVGITVADGDVVQCQYRVAAVEAFQHAGNAGDQFAPGAVTEGFVLAAAHQQYALGLEARQVLQQQRLAWLAGQVATLEQGTDGTVGGQVDSFGNGAELAPFADRYDQGGGFYGCSSYAFYNQFHVRVPE